MGKQLEINRMRLPRLPTAGRLGKSEEIFNLCSNLNPRSSGSIALAFFSCLGTAEGFGSGWCGSPGGD